MSTIYLITKQPANIPPFYIYKIQLPKYKPDPL